MGICRYIGRSVEMEDMGIRRRGVRIRGGGRRIGRISSFIRWI